MAGKEITQAQKAKHGTEHLRPVVKGEEKGPFGSLELVIHRNEFYRDGSHYLMFIVILLVAMNLFTLFFVWTLKNDEPKPRYFATDAEGLLLPIRPLTVAYLTHNELLTWAMEAATETYSFDFVNYRKQLQENRQYFTDEGYIQYMTALKSSNNVAYVIKEKMIVSAIPTGTPVVIQEGVLDGRYAWLIEIPMKLTYQNQTISRSDQVKLTLTIFRRPIVEAVKGIGIGQFVMSMNNTRPGPSGSKN